MSLAKQIPPWLWVVIIIAYFLMPLDVLPDFLGPLGRLDDLFVALWGMYQVYKRPRRTAPGSGPESDAGGARPGARGAQSRGDGGPEDGSGRSARERPGEPDPYEILDVPRGAGLEEVRARYRELLLQYHPDRVQHLGEEIREVADRRTRELNEAFESIRTDLERGR